MVGRKGRTSGSVQFFNGDAVQFGLAEMVQCILRKRRITQSQPIVDHIRDKRVNRAVERIVTAEAEQICHGGRVFIFCTFRDKGGKGVGDPFAVHILTEAGDGIGMKRVIEEQNIRSLCTPGEGNRIGRNRLGDRCRSMVGGGVGEDMVCDERRHGTSPPNQKIMQENGFSKWYYKTNESGCIRLKRQKTNRK